MMSSFLQWVLSMTRSDYEELIPTVVAQHD